MTFYTILMKKLFLIKFQDYSQQMQIKRSYLQVVFEDFVYLLGTTNLRKSFFSFTVLDHIKSMHDSLSETVFSNLITLDVVVL